MSEPRKNRPAGLGIGYVSVMIVLTVICLTVFAVLSFSAAETNRKFSEKNADFTREYYAADAAAKEILSVLDGAATEAMFFEDFCEAAQAIERVSCKNLPEGFCAEYSVPINERLMLDVSVVFPNEPQDGERFVTRRWQTIPASQAGDSNLDVWDGNSPI